MEITFAEDIKSRDLKYAENIGGHFLVKSSMNLKSCKVSFGNGKTFFQNVVGNLGGDAFFHVNK